MQLFPDVQSLVEQENVEQLHTQLLQNPADGRVKLFLLYKALNVRKELHELFSKGDYQPLTVTGRHKTHILAFARKHEAQWCLVVVPRLLAQVISENELPLGQQVWEDTALTLPDDAPINWQPVFGPQQVTASENTLFISDVLATFPVALLTATTA